MTRPDVLVYVQHLLGIGHQMRAATIIRAIEAHGMAVTCVSGGDPAGLPDLGASRLVQLPPVRAADTTFRRLVGADGRDIDEAWRERRRRALLAAFAETNPELLLIESFPFGRWQFRFELIPLLEAARASGTRIAASVRDILVEKHDPKRLDTVVGLIRTFFDAILVHGDASLVPLDITFAAVDRVRDLLRYTGYVAPSSIEDLAVTPPDGGVVVAAGGGAVGGTLMRIALQARPLTRLNEAPWRLITGPNLHPEERAVLSPASGVTIETFRPDYRHLLRQVAVSVSQAGYNTVVDLLATGARAVLVPFSADKETEQSLRARILAERGRVRVVPESELTAPALAAAIDEAAAMPPPGPTAIDLDGAVETARIVAELIGRRI